MHLAVVVCAAEPLPVDLIERLGLQHDRGDDAGSGAGDELHLDAAKEDELAGGNGGGYILGVDGEERSLVVVGDAGAGQVGKVIAWSL